MPKNSMGKDKLLQELAYLDQAEYMDKQVCAQLVEIVEGHFSLEKSIEHLVAHIKADSEPDPDTEGVEEEIIKWIDEEYSLLCQTANALPDCRSKRNLQKEAQKVKRIKQLLQQEQQKRVTREQVEEIACDLKGEMIIDDIMEMIIVWLKELGIGVEE